MSEPTELERNLYFFSLQESETRRRDLLQTALHQGAVRRETVLRELLDITLLRGNTQEHPRYPEAFHSFARRTTALGIPPENLDEVLGSYHSHLLLALNPSAEELARAHYQEF